MRVVVGLPFVFGLVTAMACGDSPNASSHPVGREDAGAEPHIDAAAEPALDAGNESRADGGDASESDAGAQLPRDGGDGQEDSGTSEPPDEEEPCVPMTCAFWLSEYNVECGSLHNGCGGTLECGCEAPATCQSDATCRCVPETDSELCAAADQECGPLSVTDRCGATRTPFCDCGGGSACHEATRSCVSLTDARDNKTYPLVRIGEQIWMARNLAHTIPDSYCYLGTLSDEECWRFGRYYTWQQAVGGSEGSTSNPSAIRGVCPEGFHLPSKAEYVQLANYILRDQGMEGDANTGDVDIAHHLKVVSQWGGPLVWENMDESYDTYGFSLLPAGRRDTGEQVAPYLNKETWLVTATQDARHYVAYAGTRTFFSASSIFNYGAVRCVRD